MTSDAKRPSYASMLCFYTLVDAEWPKKCNGIGFGSIGSQITEPHSCQKV
jgi:hypothetical protein